MIAAAIVYVLAAVTIGRMCYEFDVFTPQLPDTAMGRAATRLESVHSRRDEIIACWITGAFWFAVPLYGLWIHIKTPRPT